jgi:hypothetical protein
VCVFVSRVSLVSGEFVVHLPFKRIRIRLLRGARAERLRVQGLVPHAQANHARARVRDEGVEGVRRERRRPTAEAPSRVTSPWTDAPAPRGPWLRRAPRIARRARATRRRRRRESAPAANRRSARRGTPPPLRPRSCRRTRPRPERLCERRRERRPRRRRRARALYPRRRAPRAPPRREPDPTARFASRRFRRLVRRSNA